MNIVLIIDSRRDQPGGHKIRPAGTYGVNIPIPLTGLHPRELDRALILVEVERI